MMFQQGYIQSIAYLLGWLVLRDHQYGAFWLKIRVCVDNLDLHFLVLFCLEPMKHEHSSPLSCLVSDTDTILILHSIFWTLQVSTCLCSVSASVSVLHRLELINWHGGVVSLWSKIVSMLCNNFCSLCLHLLKTCISTSKNHFEKENNVYIDNLHISLALQERCNDIGIALNLVFFCLLGWKGISWHNGVFMEQDSINNVC